jgi:hypothetical protein
MLAVRGFEVDTVDRIVSTGRVSEDVQRLISRADLVIAVLESERSSGWVYFEVGMARGLGKPTLLLISPEMKAAVPEAAGIVHLRARPENREAILYAIDNMAAAHHGVSESDVRILESRPLRRAPKTGRPSEDAARDYLRAPHHGRTRPIGDRAERLIRQLESLPRNPSEEHVVRLLRSALEAAGVSVIADASSKAGVPDMAIWHDELQQVVGNPLAIEVKLNVPNRHALLEAANQFREYLTNSNARTGLLICVRAPAWDRALLGQWVHSDEPPVLVTRLRDFIEDLRQHNLADVIRTLVGKLS